MCRLFSRWWITVNKQSNCLLIIEAYCIYMNYVLNINLSRGVFSCALFARVGSRDAIRVFALRTVFAGSFFWETFQRNAAYSLDLHLRARSQETIRPVLRSSGLAAPRRRPFRGPFCARSGPEVALNLKGRRVLLLSRREKLEKNVARPSSAERRPSSTGFVLYWSIAILVLSRSLLALPRNASTWILLAMEMAHWASHFYRINVGLISLQNYSKTLYKLSNALEIEESNTRIFGCF